jgi:hypothetical protein
VAALRKNFHRALGYATEIGDVLLARLAVDARALGEDGHPPDIALLPVAELGPVARSTLPTDEHGLVV